MTRDEMFVIEVHPVINRMIEAFHVTLVFMKEDATFIHKMGRNLLFLIFMFSFPATIMIGAFKNENIYESLYLANLGVLSVILTMKAYYAYSKKKDILIFLRQICVHSVSDEKEFQQINKTLKSFSNFALSLLYVGITSIISLIVACLYDNSLPIKIWFPLDFENDKVYFWIAYAYVILNSLMAIAMIQFTALIWYIMVNFTISYEILGNRLRNLEATNELEISDIRNSVEYHRNIVSCVQTYKQIRLNIEQFRTFFSTLFFGQITTGGIVICLSVYLLSFGWSGNFFKYLSYLAACMYIFFDIFVVMYLGNDITISNEKLSYSLFESNWIIHTSSYGKVIIIIMSALTQPNELVIAKLYPLTLPTFTTILKVAYNMFNLLQNI